MQLRYDIRPCEFAEDRGEVLPNLATRAAAPRRATKRHGGRAAKVSGGRVQASPVRRRMNSELNFPPNFQRLVLGCIDADFAEAVMELRGDRGERVAALEARLKVKSVRTRLNNIEYFPSNFEGLVLGCIDADFCK